MSAQGARPGGTEGSSLGVRVGGRSGDRRITLPRQGGVAMIRLAVIDGQTLFRYGLRALVARQPDIEIVGECQAAAEAPAMVAEAGPDVVTVDVALPDGDGLRLARELRDRHE